MKEIKVLRMIVQCASLILFFFTSCGNSNQFTVEGNLTHTTSNKVYLAELQGSQAIPVDTAILAKDGKFSFHQKVDKPKILEIIAEGFSMEIVGEKGKTVFIKADLKDTSMNYSVFGSDLNKDLQKFVQIKQRAAKGVNKLVEELKKARTPGDTASLFARNTVIESKLEQETRDFTIKNKNNFVSLYSIIYLNTAKDYPVYKEVAASAGERFKGNPLADTLKALIVREKPTAIGEMAPPINLPAPDGKFHSLTEFRGKYVMIDFWASWCGPCRRESPLNVKLYEKYKTKGFAIFGVSLDRNKKDWLQGIQDDKLEWTQVSELKDWNSTVVTDYNFQGIPFNVLLDRDGRIIAKNLHGEELENFLQKLLH